MLIRKRKLEPQPTPPWLTWGVIGFIILAVLFNAFGVRGPSTGNETTEQLRWNIPSADTYRARLMPGWGQLQITDVKKGTGMQAVCGQEAAIRLKEIEVRPGIASAEDLALKNMTDTKVHLSDMKVPAALKSSILGMHTGGVRSVLVPAERTEGKRAPLRYVIELVALQPALPAAEGNRMPLQVFERRPGNMQEVSCGDTVNAHLTFWSMSGDTLFSTRKESGKPLFITLGRSSLPVGVEMGILGMQADAARTLIIPPNLAKPLQKPQNAQDSTVQPPGVLDSLPLPENQVILVDVELVP